MVDSKDAAATRDAESLSESMDFALTEIPTTFTADGPLHPTHDLGAPRAPCEHERMNTMLALDLNDIEAEPDQELESILKVANVVFEAPISMVILFKGDDKSNIIFVREGVGMARGDFPWPAWRWAFCGWGMWTGSCPQMMVVADAAEDARFSDNVHVSGKSGWLRFYCGAPLIASNGHHLGTMCILDSKPHDVSAGACAIVNNMAELVVRHLEKDKIMQMHDEKNLNLRAAYHRMERALDCFDHCVVLVDTSEDGFRITFVNEAWGALTGMSREDAVGHTLGELMESSQVGKTVPGREHVDAVERREEFTVKEVLIKSCKGGSGKSFVLKFRPADSEGIDDDAMPIGVPTCVIKTSSGVEPARSPLYFVAVQEAMVRAAKKKNGSSTWSSCARSSSTVKRNGALIEGLKLRQLIGKGAFGSVYAATWFGTSVAVKVIDHVPGGDDPAMESSVTSNLRHPHIVATLKTWVHKTAKAPAATKPVVPEPLYEPGSIVRLAAGYNAAVLGDQQGLNVGQGVIDVSKSEGKQSSTSGPGWAVIDMVSSLHTLDDDDGGCALEGVAKAEKSGQAALETLHDSGWTSIGSQAAAEPETDPMEEAMQTWMIMDYCDKGSLQDGIDRGYLLDQRSCVNGKPKMDSILALAMQVASAMCYLHSQDVMHGDLSSWNVLLSSSGSVMGLGYDAKVADFGLARNVPEKITAQTYGTITHMPPETLKSGTVSKAVDVYSFGVLLWQMYTSSQPWRGMSHAQITLHVVSQTCKLELPLDTPQAYADLTLACLSFSPEDRPDFKSICDMIDAM